jgi:G:T-mismatch repair DNA endonuclease (very short patch repair protein)
LRTKGWHVTHVWQCELKDISKAIAKIERFLTASQQNRKR